MCSIGGSVIFQRWDWCSCRTCDVVTDCDEIHVYSQTVPLCAASSRFTRYWRVLTNRNRYFFAMFGLNLPPPLLLYSVICVQATISGAGEVRLCPTGRHAEPDDDCGKVCAPVFISRFISSFIFSPRSFDLRFICKNTWIGDTLMVVCDGSHCPQVPVIPWPENDGNLLRTTPVFACKWNIFPDQHDCLTIILFHHTVAWY